MSPHVTTMELDFDSGNQNTGPFFAPPLSLQQPEDVPIRIEKNGQHKPRRRRLTEVRRMQNRQAQRNYRSYTFVFEGSGEVGTDHLRGERQKRRLEELEDFVSKKRRRGDDQAQSGNTDPGTISARTTDIVGVKEVVHPTGTRAIGSGGFMQPWVEDADVVHTPPSGLPRNASQQHRHDNLSNTFIASNPPGMFSQASVADSFISTEDCFMADFTGGWNAPTEGYTFVGSGSPTSFTPNGSRYSRNHNTRLRSANKNTSSTALQRTSHAGSRGLISLIQAGLEALGLSPSTPATAAVTSSSSSSSAAETEMPSGSTPATRPVSDSIPPSLSFHYNPSHNPLAPEHIPAIQSFLANAALLGMTQKNKQAKFTGNPTSGETPAPGAAETQMMTRRHAPTYPLHEYFLDEEELYREILGYFSRGWYIEGMKHE